MISLDKIILDKPCIIKKVNATSSIKRRFIDIGIIPNAKITKVLTSPFGGISAYSIMGTTIAIRNNDAKEIEVEYEKI